MALPPLNKDYWEKTMVANEGEVSEGVQKLEIDPSDRNFGLNASFYVFLVGLDFPYSPSMSWPNLFR